MNLEVLEQNNKCQCCRRYRGLCESGSEDLRAGAGGDRLECGGRFLCSLHLILQGKNHVEVQIYPAL